MLPELIHRFKKLTLSACLLFGGLHFDEAGYLELWQRLEPDPATPEVIRNLPLRHPVLWVDTD